MKYRAETYTRVGCRLVCKMGWAMLNYSIKPAKKVSVSIILHDHYGHQSRLMRNKNKKKHIKSKAAFE